MNPLDNKRILVCGKGGSGKSSFTAMLGEVLQKKNYKVILIDGDASNPGGLTRLVGGVRTPPKSLISFFGGREKVTCPTDDPSPLTRISDSIPVCEVPIDLSEIPHEYYIKKDNLLLFQVGKIEKSYEGCDGPMSKISRDLIFKGDYVIVIDVEAGIEHFGRGVERNVDVVLVIVDPTLESFETAGRVVKLSGSIGIEHVWAVLNKIDSEETESIMRNELDKRTVNILGKINLDRAIYKAGLEGTRIGKCAAAEQILDLAQNLESLAVLNWN
jgi:CO dehydrogenase maturation factor